MNMIFELIGLLLVVGCAFLSLIHISEPTRLGMISYAVFCLKKKKKEYSHLLEKKKKRKHNREFKSK